MWGSEACDWFSFTPRVVGEVERVLRCRSDLRWLDTVCHSSDKPMAGDVPGCPLGMVEAFCGPSV